AACRSQQERSRVDGPAGDDDERRAHGHDGAVALELDVFDPPARSARHEATRQGAVPDRDVRVLERAIHAAYLRITLAVDAAGERVARAAQQAAARQAG